jgi:hypothetical protein
VGGRRAALDHASTMPSRGECCNALLRPPWESSIPKGTLSSYKGRRSRAIVRWSGDDWTDD